MSRVIICLGFDKTILLGYSSNWKKADRIITQQVGEIVNERTNQRNSKAS